MMKPMKDANPILASEMTEKMAIAQFRSNLETAKEAAPKSNTPVHLYMAAIITKRMLELTPGCNREMLLDIERFLESRDELIRSQVESCMRNR